ncbi:hypothetical protein [Streptomyces sp. CC224B]|uniref:hypothetical protein n=1 Tax=Streptomyces sp. CC224B TaxID=3044571 RepID=UPI0024A9FD88|nr:hypothetical protein [Streptomyces sp. CC224B]
MKAVSAGPREWAGTTQDAYDLHRFTSDRRARCNTSIRTYSRITDHDHVRWPYMTLRTRAEIEGLWAAYMYTFCPACAGSKESRHG